MASPSSAALAVIRRRPLTSVNLLSGTGVAVYAFSIEYASQQRERRYLLQRAQNDLLSSSSTEQNATSNILEHGSTSPILPRVFDSDSINNYWKNRPISTVKRFFQVFSELAPLAASYIKDFVLFPVKQEDGGEVRLELERQYAIRLREALTNLGPAFVKAGQQLSIRPDLIPPGMLRELQKLCDSVRPITDEIAMQVIRQELNVQDLDAIFSELTLVASASLGQVYKGRLVQQGANTTKNSGNVVAVKVQRPDIRRTFSLDLFLLQKIGVFVDVFTSVFTNQPPFHQPLYESFARGSYSELDYEQEAANQIIFREEFAKRNCPVIVPSVYTNLTTERVLTTEWIDGMNLTDAPQDLIRKLIPVGVELFLTQLLDIGRFHSDPHGANLLVTPEGKLALLDFGLCAEVDEKSRNAMTAAIVNLITRDFDALVEKDAKELGFLPHDFDTQELKPLLTKILTVGLVDGGSDMRKRRRKLMEISNELNEVFFRYPFSVPPFFALVTRGLGVLEGIALAGDPDFDIFRASAPYARRRAVALLGRSTFRRKYQRVNEQ